jgi:hypothetical protein
VLAGEEGDDAVAVVEIDDVEEQRFAGQQAHDERTLAAGKRADLAAGPWGGRYGQVANARVSWIGWNAVRCGLT